MFSAWWLRYVIVWVALMLLALFSYLLSRADLGKMDVMVALLIALAKTALVVVYFMELVHHRATNSLVMLLSGGFIVLLLALMVADVATRHTFPKGPVPVLDGTAKK